MASSYELMGIAFFIVFVMLMTSGLNASYMNSGALATSHTNPMCANKQIEQSLTSAPSIAIIGTGASCLAGDWACGIVSGVNAIIGVLNTLISAFSYAISFISMMFSPCGIFQGNYLIMGVVFVPIFIGAIYLINEMRKL